MYSLNKLYVYIVVLCYSYLFVYIIPWDSLIDLRDIDNYINQITTSNINDINNNYSIFSLGSEYIWRFLIFKISQFGDSLTYYRDSLLFISFISLIVYANFLFKRINIIIGSIFLFNPLFVFLIIAQMRMALAFALLILAFEFRHKFISIILMLFAISIHSASLFFIFSFYILKKIYRKFPNRKYFIVTLLMGFLITLFLKFGIYYILDFIGDRRAGTLSITASSNIKFTLFWFIISLLLVYKANSKDEKIKYIISFSILMSSLFFFSSIFGFYGQRFMAVAVPLVIVSIYYMPTYYRLNSYIALFLFTVVQWLYVFHIFPI
jgi:hypothetical protein